MIALSFGAVESQLRPVAEWLGTFAVHSTLALGLTWALTRSWRRRALGVQDSLLRQALWLPIVSSLLQHLVFGSPWRWLWTAPVAEPPRAAAIDLEAMVAAALEAPLTMAPTPVVAVAVASEVPWATLLVAGAALAAVVGLSCLWRTYRRLTSLLKARRPESDTRVLVAASSLATALGLQQTPHISRADRLATPIAFGLLRPEICLPARAARLPDASLRAMLGHELTHLRRADPAWMWLAAWVHALFPWQLLLVAVRRQWSRVVELRCDAAAAAHTSPTAVARCLLEVAEWLRPDPARPMVALGMAARPSALRERVEAALNATEPPPVRRLLAGGLAVTSLAAMTFAAPGLQVGPDGGQAPVSAWPTALAPAAAPAGSGRDLRELLQLVDSEHADLIAEAGRLHASLRALPTPESARLQQVLQQRLSNIARLRARLEARLGGRVSGNR